MLSQYVNYTIIIFINIISQVFLYQNVRLEKTTWVRVYPSIEMILLISNILKDTYRVSSINWDWSYIRSQSVST